MRIKRFHYLKENNSDGLLAFQDLIDEFDITDSELVYHNTTSDKWFGYLTNGENQICYRLTMTLDITDIDRSLQFYTMISYISKHNDIELNKSNLSSADRGTKFSIWIYTKEIIKHNEN